MNVCAVIPAAGSGTRAGFSRNKVLQPLGGVPVLVRTVSAFAQNKAVARIAVCVNEQDRAQIEELLAPFAGILLVAGGETRTQSVANALEALAALPCPPDYVLVHDAARPFVSQKIIGDCIRTVREHGSAVCALPCTDTLVRAQSGMICGTLERRDAWLLQTPQGFGFADLLSAYRRIAPEDSFTDDSGVYAKYVAPPFLFTGERTNVKLTYPEDFAMESMRTGIGIDTHAFGAGDHIVLGGVRIPHSRGLIAHSDGDVLCHAVMDALLSAAGLADIGTRFPDSDPQYKGADSLLLLSRVRAFVEEAGFCAVNVSAAIVAQAPKLAPHIAQMKANIARVLGIAESAVGISAGTSEGLGFLGRGEGITVTASALLRSYR